jgi:hypothetical protein
MATALGAALNDYVMDVSCRRNAGLADYYYANLFVRTVKDLSDTPRNRLRGKQAWNLYNEVVHPWIEDSLMALRREAKDRGMDPNDATFQDVLGIQPSFVISPDVREDVVARSSDRRPQRPRRKRFQWMAEALLLCKDYPEWPDARIARMVGVDKGTLSRNKMYRAAAMLGRQGTPPPKGNKDGKTGRIEAYEDPER